MFFNFSTVTTSESIAFVMCIKSIAFHVIHRRRIVPTLTISTFFNGLLPMCFRLELLLRLGFASHSIVQQPQLTEPGMFVKVRRA